jgi:hypothetical protein
MFGKHHTLKRLSVGFAIVASVAVVAVPSALGAHAARAHSQACQTGTGWITVIDEQGIANLEPTGQASRTDTLACTAAADGMRSPYAGWVMMPDETGVPWLYPAGLSPLTSTQQCAQAQAAPAADTRISEGANVSASPTMRSPYPGWVIVTDETGVPWLYPIGQAGN